MAKDNRIICLYTVTEPNNDFKVTDNVTDFDIKIVDTIESVCKILEKHYIDNEWEVNNNINEFFVRFYKERSYWMNSVYKDKYKLIIEFIYYDEDETLTKYGLFEHSINEIKKLKREDKLDCLI